jgi:chromosome segregation ATPase
MDPRGRKPKRVDIAPLGELVFETGAEEGRRWALHVPTSFVGSAAGCDLRLAEQDVEPFHCLFVFGPEGLVVRDLESALGTYVNGQRIDAVELKDGDRIQVGTAEFSLLLRNPVAVILPTPAKKQHDAMRVQVAAVAAQQIALDEDEANLGERAAALEQKEEQAHRRIDEKRQVLHKAHEATQAERQALLRERLAYERHIERITSNLTDAQRDVLQKQQHLELERTRLVKLLTSLKERYRRMSSEETARLEQKEQELAAREARTKAAEDRLRQRRIQFNTDLELGRHHLRESWSKLKQAQLKWKHRRGNERAALKVFSRDLQEAEINLYDAAKKLDHERETWEQTKTALATELQSLDERVHNQRRLLASQREELGQLEERLREQRETVANFEAGAAAVAPERKNGRPERELVRLSYLAEELSDQRRMLAEQRHRLGLLQASWQEDRDRTVAELETLTRELAEASEALRHREEACAESEESLEQRRLQLSELRHKVFARNAELKVRESAWDAERGRLLAEVSHREELAEKTLASLVELRHRWARRRHVEVDRLNEERAALVAMRADLDRKQLEINKRLALADDQKRAHAERHIALEQLRLEIVGRADPEAERRVERLRRRWLAHNAGVLRTIAAERSAMENERRLLDQRFADLQQQLESLAAADNDLQQKILAWENQQAVVQARHARAESTAHVADSQKAVLERQLLQMKEQIEGIAKDLLDEDPPPASLDRAA